MLKTYESRDALMKTLALQIAAELRTVIATQENALLSVPGGSTPVPFFNALSEQPLPWNAVTICLNDERMVEESSHRSNTALLKRELLHNAASEASFLDLRDKDAPFDVMLPIDVLVLGMGSDMHTASLFPTDENIKAALADDAEDVIDVTPIDQPEARRSFSARVLREARHKHVLITGDEKYNAFQQAHAESDEQKAPIRIMMQGHPAIFHWAK